MEQKPWPYEISSSKMQSFNAWDAKSILSNLSFLEQKIHQVQHIVSSIANQNGKNLSFMSNEDLTAIILDLISTAGSLLPSIKRSLFSSKDPSLCPPPPKKKKESAMEVLQLEKDEILAPHTHFCSICGKGFKRDANLRMHMRGHGDEYKTPAALAKPGKDSSPPAAVKRYSCPFSGCKRNRDHRNFQPLKTLLCVKNHYKRSHCEKSFSCSRCLSKKFSVLADLKTHEKHCGRDKWLCSCGTTFSRKDKLFGHVALFQGHAPALPFDDGSRPSDSVRLDPSSGIDPEHQCSLPFEDETSDDEFLKAALGLWENSSNTLFASSFLSEFD